MAEVSPLAELLGQALYQFDLIKPLLSTYGHVILSALFPLYIGAHASLSRPGSAAKPTKNSDEDAGNESENEDDDEESGNDDQKMEGLAPSDAIVFPLTAGLTLGGLYLVINWMGADMLNKILGFYFSHMGMFFAMAFVKDGLSVLRSFIFPRKFTRGGQTWKPRPTDRVFAIVPSPTTSEPVDTRRSPLPGIFGLIPLPNIVLKALWTCREIIYWRAKLRVHIHRILHLECSLTTMDILSGFISLPAVGYFTFVSKPWWLTNFLGFSFSYGTLQLMSPSTFVTGSLILGSLFFYDIYFVYFTPLMVTVAKELDVPIKLLFPRPPAPTDAPAPTNAPDTVSLAMLGLGDIIIPGMMVGLALRFDLYLYYKQKGMLKARAEGEDADCDCVKPVYQPVTGGWGERFWAPSVRSNEPDLEPPYRDARSFPKTYFKASIVGYTFGMITTLAVMQIFDHPQPALLYLVPGILLSLWGTALAKGQISEMWEFSDAEEDEDEDTTEKGEEKDQKDKVTSSDKGRGLFARIFSRHNELATSQTLDKPSGKEEQALVAQSEKASDMVEEKESQSNDKPKTKSDNKDDSKHLDLFSFSLYVPRKAGSKKSEAAQGGAVNSTIDDESWSYVGVGKQENEPPAKRRRRSPRNLSNAGTTE
ncbi:signal peptide peptidase-domain-containing protein [Aspergillus cavernicola]|uniref:Signal peptide peptidase-domain-containing protein n=1 Tax=Aspergillus cavernicola TaxID=176166 RepID=A0ABR4ITQ0_9EURO